MNDDPREDDEGDRPEADRDASDDRDRQRADDRLERARPADDLELEREQKAESGKKILLDLPDLPESAARRLEEARELRVLSPEKYAEELRKRGKTDEEIESTPGIRYGAEDLTLVRDETPTIVTIIHEDLHVASENGLPRGFNEGVTELYARRAAGGVGDMMEAGGTVNPLEAPPRPYDQEVHLVSRLESIVGGKAVSDAYFDGSDDQLRGLVDARVGEGAYERFASALDARDYQSADKIIKDMEKDFHARGY